MPRENTTELYLEEYFAYKYFIEKCRCKLYPKDVALHWHHIIPKALGGSNSKENLVQLSVEDHQIAHQMFALAFDEGSKEAFVNLAASMLLNKSIKTTEQLNEHRKLYLGELNPFYGKTHSDETKQILREKTRLHRTGKSYEEFYGEEKAETEKQKRAAGVRDFHQKLTDEQKKNRSENISIALLKLNRTTHNAVPVKIDGQEFRSIAEAAKQLNLTVYKLKKYMKETNQ